MVFCLENSDEVFIVSLLLRGTAKKHPSEVIEEGFWLLIYDGRNIGGLLLSDCHFKNICDIYRQPFKDYEHDIMRYK